MSEVAKRYSVSLDINAPLSIIDFQSTSLTSKICLYRHFSISRCESKNKLHESTVFVFFYTTLSKKWHFLCSHTMYASYIVRDLMCNHTSHQNMQKQLTKY